MATIPQGLFTIEEFAALDKEILQTGRDVVPGFAAPFARIFG